MTPRRSKCGSAASIPARPPMDTPPLVRGPVIQLTALFFCSGLIGLIYEVIWQRQFALVFGSAAPATAAVLAAYFTALGLGSLMLGGPSTRWRPLRAYAILEALIGVGGLMVPVVLSGFERLHPWLFQHLAANLKLFFLVKMVLCFFALALPTFCMGGTLPVLGQLVDHGRRHLGTTAGLLYAANTFGAAIGALLPPFLLLPAFGVTKSLWLAAGGNFLVALAAWRMDRTEGASEKQPNLETSRGSSSRTVLSWRQPLLAWSLISGAITFILQVLWNRAFAQVHENSIYSFAVIAAIFIFALAVGAQFARWGLRRGITSQKLLGWAWVLGGALVALSPVLFLKLTNGLSYLPSDGGWSRYGMRLVAVGFGTLFLPIMLLGMGFPAIMEQAGRRQDTEAGPLLGQLLVTNLIGSVAGVVIAGFLLPAWLGLWRSISLMAGVLVVAGVWQFELGKTNSARTRLILGGLFVASLWPISRIDWPRVRIASGQGERLVAITEGTDGIVAVAERPNSRRLKLNNFYVLGGTSSTGDERMQAHLPLLLHPSPKRVAVLGLGTGITAGGALFHPVHDITIVELVPEVVEAARNSFRDSNAAVLENRKTHIVVEDARNYLRGTGEKFDVIIGDLVVPWRQGEGSLFTEEHFRAAALALAPGGLFCQWLPLFQLSEPELQILIRTFLTVFPRALVLRGDFSPNEPALALVASTGPIDLTTTDIPRRLHEMNADPSNPQLVDPMVFWMYFIGTIESSDLSPREIRVNREDRPWIELVGPMGHAGGRTESFFVGRRMQNWINQIRESSAGRLHPFGPVETAGDRAGDLLLEFSLRLSEGNTSGAESVEADLRTILPAPAFNSIFSDVAK